jgi:hypothetical protein
MAVISEGRTITQVARDWGVSGQAVHAWLIPTEEAGAARSEGWIALPMETSWGTISSRFKLRRNRRALWGKVCFGLLFRSTWAISH